MSTPALRDKIFIGSEKTAFSYRLGQTLFRGEYIWYIGVNSELSFS